MRGAAPGGQASSSGLVNCPRHDLCSGKTCQLAVSSSSSRLSTPPSGPHPPAPQHSTLTTVAHAAASRDRDSAGHGCGAASGLSNTERFAAIKASRTALLNTLASLKKRHRHSIVRARAAAAAAPAAADRRTGRERGRAATSAAGRKGGGAGGSIGTRIGYSPPSTVVFKDENSSVIAEVPAAVAARLDADITHVVTRLVADPAFAADRHANLEKAFVLQDRMRKGLQRISDFADLGALFGYARRKFRSRAITAYALLRSACDALPPELAVLLTEPAGRVTTVVSIGGGPGNDIFGYVLFVRHGAFVRGGGTDDATAAAGTVDGDAQADLNVVDFASGWGTIVSRVAELTGQPIRFRGCDLKEPFAADANLALRDLSERRGADVVVYLLCYVLNEVMGPTGDPSCLRIIDHLWERAAAAGHTAIFLFREQNQRAVRTLLDHRPRWREGEDYWLLPAGGLVAVARRQNGRSR